jgi:hypothetical protein
MFNSNCHRGISSCLVSVDGSFQSIVVLRYKLYAKEQLMQQILLKVKQYSQIQKLQVRHNLWLDSDVGTFR